MRRRGWSSPCRMRSTSSGANVVRPELLAATAEDAASLVETQVFLQGKQAQAENASISTIAHPGEPLVLDLVSRIVPQQNAATTGATLPSRC